MTTMDGLLWEQRRLHGKCQQHDYYFLPAEDGVSAAIRLVLPLDRLRLELRRRPSNEISGKRQGKLSGLHAAHAYPAMAVGVPFIGMGRWRRVSAISIPARRYFTSAISRIVFSRRGFANS